MVNKKRCLDELRGSSNLRISHLLACSSSFPSPFKPVPLFGTQDTQEDKCTKTSDPLFNSVADK